MPGRPITQYNPNLGARILTGFTTARGAGYLDSISDHIVWYARDKKHIKYRQLFLKKDAIGEIGQYNFVEIEKGKVINIKEIKNSEKIVNRFAHSDTTSQGETPAGQYKVFFEGRDYLPPKNRHWSTSPEGMHRLIEKNRIFVIGDRLRYKRYLDDYPVFQLTNNWGDTSFSGFGDDKRYVVQTHPLVIQRCLLMTSDPGDLVLDITCGSGTTAYVAEQWGRRWITCDTSRVALTLAKQRLMTASFDYYQLAHPKEGIGSGFVYKTVPHITLKSIANNEPPATETLYDKPLPEKGKSRITGPFTVEAVPAPYAKSFDDLETEDGSGDTSIARTGETLRQGEWRDELRRSGVRAKNGQMIMFSRVEPLSGPRYIQAEAETQWSDAGGDHVAEVRADWRPEKVLVVFGPEHAPLEQRMVENALEEARFLKPDILLFCAFQFDEEAAKDIDEAPEHLIGFKLLKAQMNADLLTDDLRKKRSSNESFWLVGQPDVKVHKQEGGMLTVEVLGFDYYNPKTGNVESGGKKNIAMWMLDTDYNNRSLFPSQVFFPMAGAKDGWARLAKNLKAEIDMEKIDAFKGAVSLPFQPGKTIAVKIIDDRGIECLRVLKV